VLYTWGSVPQRNKNFTGRRGDPFCRWLLIFDNADQPEEIMDLIPRDSGDALIIFRNHRWQSVLDTVPMDMFTRAESIEFLTKRVAPAGAYSALHNRGCGPRRGARRVGDRIGVEVSRG